MVASRSGNACLVLGCPSMTKRARRAIFAMVAIAVVAGLAWLGRTQFSCSKIPVPTVNEETPDPAGQQAAPSSVGASSSRTNTRTAITASAENKALVFKVYRSDLCFFAAARIRSIRPSADASPPSWAGHLRAVHACEMAATQSEPSAPALDKALAAFVPLVKASAPPVAFDEEWRHLGHEIEAWRARNPVEPSGDSESERLARVAFENARAMVARIALESNPAWAFEGWLQAARLQLRESIVALARYGTEHAPDAWITVVEPALEALLRELQEAPTGQGQDDSNLMRVFLILIEAYQRAMTSN